MPRFDVNLASLQLSCVTCFLRYWNVFTKMNKEYNLKEIPWTVLHFHNLSCGEAESARQCSYAFAISLIILMNITIPLRKILSFKNSLWSWSKTGVLGIGENPSAGIPTSLRYWLSVPAGNIFGAMFMLLLSHPFLNARNQTSSAAVDVTVWSVNLESYWIVIYPPAWKDC